MDYHGIYGSSISIGPGSSNLVSCSNSANLIRVHEAEFETLVNDSKEWHNIKELAKENPTVNHHLEELLAVVKLVKGED